MTTLNANRRRYLMGLGATIAASSMIGCGDDRPTDTAIHWKMACAWPSNMSSDKEKSPVEMGFFDSAERLASKINQLCLGRLRISVHPANELAPAFGVFDAVQRGSVQMGHGLASFWQGKSPATPFFAGLPFGMTANETNAWLLAGGGMELWQELYQHFNLLPFPAGNCGPQMAGWFKRTIRSVRTIRGLKLRVTGLSAKTWERIGGVAVNVAGNDLKAALAGEQLDAAEWLSPWHDLALGLQESAKNYYYPSWNEPSTTLECIVNKSAFETLEADLQTAIRTACIATHAEESALMQARNQQALIRLVSDHQVRVSRLPADVLQALRLAADQVIAELANSDQFAKKVFESASAFREQANQWQRVGDRAYLDARG